MEPFGSFVSNLFTSSGDLDISIELANGLFISSSGKKEKQILLRTLMRAMRQKGRYIFVFLVINSFSTLVLFPWSREYVIQDLFFPIESNYQKVYIHYKGKSCNVDSKTILWHHLSILFQYWTSKGNPL